MSRYIKLGGLAAGVMLVAAGADAATLPLKAGTYVREGSACRQAPFAVQFNYASGAFSYPHATQCRSTIVRHQGRSYVVNETCAALGDGTPAKADALTTRYRVLSPSRVEVQKLSVADRTVAIYRRCPVEVN